MYKSAILILLYNKEISESKTLTSIAMSERQFKNAKIIIWNNEPKKLKSNDVSHLVDLNYKVEIKETLQNESLAVIYNWLIKNIQAQKYIYDDSSLTEKHIEAACNSGFFNISMPIITSSGKVESPKINSNVYNGKHKILPTDEVIAIGNGLVIGSDVVFELNKHFDTVFNERYFLYGVDTTFCYRLIMSNLSERIRFIAGFEHSLSRLENENEQVVKFRKKERSYDTGLTLKYYFSLPNSVYILARYTIRALKRFVLNEKNNISLLSLFKAYFSSKHYRTS